MSNGEIQTDTSKEKVIRKSRIRKGIQRTLNTAKYESIVITDEIEEEIEWSSVEERERKINNWTTLLLKGFKESHDRILDELGLSQKKAYFKTLADKDDDTNLLDDMDTID